MPIATVTRPTITAARIGARYAFADGHRTFPGRVVALRKLSPTHTTVEVELSDDDYRRLLEIDPA